MTIEKQIQSDLKAMNFTEIVIRSLANCEIHKLWKSFFQ